MYNIGYILDDNQIISIQSLMSSIDYIEKRFS